MVKCFYIIYVSFVIACVNQSASAIKFYQNRISGKRHSNTQVKVCPNKIYLQENFDFAVLLFDNLILFYEILI